MMKINTTRKPDNKLQQTTALDSTPKPKRRRIAWLLGVPFLASLILYMAVFASTGDYDLTMSTIDAGFAQISECILSAAVQNAKVTEETMDVRLTNMYGVTLDQSFVDGQWVLSKDQDVLVWMDLPTDIENLSGSLESTFPYEVKAGESGVIEIKVTSYKNNTIYNGTLEFVAADDLTLETGVWHSLHGNSGQVSFWNNTSYEMNCLEDILGDGKKSYLHYSLFTSAENEPIILYGDASSVGYSMSYQVGAVAEGRSARYLRGDIYDPELKAKIVPLEPAPGEDKIPPTDSHYSDSEIRIVVPTPLELEDPDINTSL